MVDFNDLPHKVLKKFIIVENNDELGNRLFIIKKQVPFNERTNYYRKHSSKDIPHKYQQNNSLEEASNSIRQYVIEEMCIEPNLKINQTQDYFLMSFLRRLKRFFVKHL